MTSPKSKEQVVPEDIFQTACGIVMEAKSLKSMLRHKDVVDAIAAAILTERERCASFAEVYELQGHPGLSPGAELNAWWSGQGRAYEAMRRRIRMLPTPPKGGEE